MPIVPVVHRVALTEQEPDSVYWRTRPYAERLAALEEIRQEYHRWKYHAEPRLQRVCRITQR